MTGYSATATGQVIRPALAMFNHSCDPNMVRVDRGKYVIAAACADINKGVEVRDSYGGTFYEEEKDDRRQKLMKDFWFKCMCEACRKRWPCREDLPCNMFEVHSSYNSTCVSLFLQVRECQLLVSRAETDTYAAIMDQYMANIMKMLRQELTTGDGDVMTTIKLWRQYYTTLTGVVTKPYLGYIKVTLQLSEDYKFCLS